MSKEEEKEKKISKKARALTAVILAVVIFAASFVVYLGFLIPTGIITVGMNLSSNNYYSRQLMFNDIMFTATSFRAQPNWQMPTFPVDENDGYPLEIPYNGEYAAFLINCYYEGDYVLLYDGDGEFNFSGGVEVKDKQPNRIDLKYDYYENHRMVTIMRSNKNNPVKNIRIIPLEYANKESSMPRFRADFLKGLEGMPALRFMDLTATNGSKQSEWTDRPIPSDFTFEGRGIPYEYMIELCNVTGKDGWFCVPHLASDDYILKFAQMLKSGLSKTVTAYIEYSNEVWNWGFDQAHYVANNAPGAVDDYVSKELEEIAEGDGKFHIKGAYMMSRTFRLFESVFTGKDRKRIVTVGAIQTAWTGNTRQIIQYWQENDRMPDAIAGTAYFGYETGSGNDTAIPQEVIKRENADELNEYFHNKWNANPKAVTADDVLDAVFLLWDYTVKPAAVETAALIKASGARFFVYEGGQHMQPHKQGVWEYNQAVWDAQISPRMYDLYMQNLTLYSNLGCELFMNFSYVSQRESQYGSWGVLENQKDVYNENIKTLSPKYAAIQDANKKKGYF